MTTKATAPRAIGRAIGRALAVAAQNRGFRTARVSGQSKVFQPLPFPKRPKREWKTETMVEAIRLALFEQMQSVEYASDADLLAACRRQDLRAFEQLYLMHGARLKSIAYHIVGNRQDAEDAVQETFLKLHRAIAGFHGDSSIGTWLCRIVINVCHDLARKRKREAGPDETDRGVGNSGQLALRVALNDALGRIHPRYRMVFLLFEVEGLRHAEIAGILEIPEGTCKAWLFEAKKELKRILTEARR
jgi:RNA polymerase sigma-70 factor (ECF subfamily)